MKTIGLIGGMSWESTAVYYRLLNTLVRERRGGLHSARIAMWSVDFGDIAPLQASGDWDALTGQMIDAARRLERAGADLLLIGANTMHLMADDVQAAISIPLVHIADAAAGELRAASASRPLLLGTRFTMEKPFYAEHLAEGGAYALIPSEADRTEIHRIIYDELCQGVISPAAKAEYLRIIAAGVAGGADSVLFGCTEIGLLLSQDDVAVPVVDTAEAHCRAAVESALA
jgi:aspartate racemase